MIFSKKDRDCALLEITKNILSKKLLEIDSFKVALVAHTNRRTLKELQSFIYGLSTRRLLQVPSVHTALMTHFSEEITYRLTNELIEVTTTPRIQKATP